MSSPASLVRPAAPPPDSSVSSIAGATAPAPPAAPRAEPDLKARPGEAGPGVREAAILRHLPQAVAVVDAGRTILWENGRLAALLDRSAAGGGGGAATIVGRDLYESLGATDPEAQLMRAGGCPVRAVLGDAPRACGAGETAENVLEVGDRDFALAVRALAEDEEEDGGAADALPRAVVAIRDVSAEVRHRRKLDAIRQAGEELGDLMPEELPDMTAEDRVELLRGKVLQFTRDLMEFDTVEIRLLDDHTGELRPLLSSGMAEGVAELPLRADPERNGSTGLVAATGRPYLCHDTACDPHYLPGAPGARSALTVPLKLGEQVLGTFNVERVDPAAFTEDDLRFAELFAREIAAALHTLELLVAEKYSTARESTERTLREVAGPLDEVLQDAAWLLERYIGHGHDMSDRLKRVLARSREIKTLIHRVGEELRPEPTRTPLPVGPVRPTLKGARVLVADSDDSVRHAAHQLLGRVGCEVETAHDAAEALLMARNGDYDAALVDVRIPPGDLALDDATADEASDEPGAAPAPPDLDSHADVPAGGYDCFCGLREHAPELPVIFMTGYGYDPGHSIVRARREGLHGVLYKPFRPEQLLGELETAVA